MPLPIELAIIGGTGFYDMPGLEIEAELTVETPFGPASDAIRTGTIEGMGVAFLARHGRGHTILPGELPQRANMWALKSLGVSRVLSVSAVGSLQEAYAPGDIVIPDQLIDRTRGDRPASFFGEGIVAHVAFADPFCGVLREAAAEAARKAGATVHEGGSCVVIEGPAFGTRAESELYRSWGASLVGMTALPEAKLAREAELCYASISAVTDYDAWHPVHDAVDAQAIIRVLQRNAETSRETIRRLLQSLPSESCVCGRALDAALLTHPDAIPGDLRTRLAPILARRLGGAP